MASRNARSIFFCVLCLGVLVVFGPLFLGGYDVDGLTRFSRTLHEFSGTDHHAASRMLSPSPSPPSSHGTQPSASSTGHASTGHASPSSHHGHHKSPAFDPMVYFMLAYFGSILTQQVVYLLPEFIRPPHSVLLYCFGMISAGIADQNKDTEYGVAVAGFELIDPHVIFWVFLPVLLYEDAAASDWHVVSRVLPSAILLALPGVVVNAVLTAALIRIIDIIPFEPALLLGSILSATDPVAVVGALAALQAPLKLSSIISGESLLNDGSAVVLFQIFLDVAAGRKEFSIGVAFEKLFRLAGGGVAFGLAVALVAKVWLAKTKSFTIQITLIVLCIFFCFFVPEHPKFQMSGVLAVVTFGFFMAAKGKFDLAVDKEHEHHAIVNFLAFVSNEAIFIIAGCVGYHFSFQSPYIGGRDWGHLALLYIGVHVTRGLTILSCYPILHNIGYRLGAKEAIICVIGGLRGAVGLALGLQVMGDADIPRETRDKIAFHTNGIVLGTLFLNGVFVTPVYKLLQIQSPKRAKHHGDLLKLLLHHADHMVAERTDILATHWFFQHSNREIITNLVPSLLDGFVHAEEDYYGRMHHVRELHDVIAEEMMKLVEQIKGEDHVAGFQDRMKGAASPDNPNIFHSASLEKSQSKVEAMLELEPPTPPKVNKSEPEETAGDIDEAVVDCGKVKTAASEVVIGGSGTGSTAKKVNFKTNYHYFALRTSLREMERKSTAKGAAEEPEFNPEVVEDVDGLMIELHQTLVNSKKAAYTQMYENRTLTKHAYDFLLSSIDHSTEAINGDLQAYSWLRKKLPDLHTQDQVAQMKASPRVAFEYIRTHLHHTRNPVSNFFRYSLRKSQFYEWLVFRRNVRILLAYSMVIKMNMNELHHAKEAIFDHNECAKEVIQGMLLLLEELDVECKTELMMNEVQKRPGMFRCYEHILFADLIVVQQQQVLKELVEEGNLGETDVENFVKNCTAPLTNALDYWAPTHEQLETIGGAKIKTYYHFLDGIIAFWQFITNSSRGVALQL